jgi:hypothetical protein
MRPFPHLLGIPRELRNQIYEAYARTEHGFFFNPWTGKLTADKNRPIDLSLMYTCRLIAEEMLAAVFRVNTIVFEPVCSSEVCARASRFSDNFEFLQYHETALLHRVSQLIDPSMADEVLKYFPQYRSRIDLSQNNPVSKFLRTSPPRHSLEEAPSVRRGFIRHLILKAQEHHRFWEFASNLWRVEPNPIDVLSVDLAPWAVPSDEDLIHMDYALGTRLIRKNGRGSYGEYQERHFQGLRDYGFSAASAAIQFLYSIPKALRLLVCKVQLLEIRETVAHPQCHAQGLIPLCVENPQLRVERRVALWTNILAQYPQGAWSMNAEFDGLPGPAIHRAIAPWILEAGAMPFYGMPAGSFSFIIDGAFASEDSSVVLKSVKRDAHWRLAYEEPTDGNGVALRLITE